MRSPGMPRRFRRPLLAAVAAVTAGLVVAAVPDALAASDSRAGSGHPSTAQSHPMLDISVTSDRQDGATLAQRLDDAGYDVHARTGAVVRVLGSSATAKRLAAIPGVRVLGTTHAAPTGPIPQAPANQDDILPRRLKGNTYQTYYGGYRTVSGYDTFESDLAAAYPHLVQTVSYGTSYTGANALNAVCITAKAQKGCQLTPDVHKARFLVMAQIHAREIATSEMAWRFMTRLVDGWKRDPQTTSLLKSTEVWIVPQVNPDGVDIVQHGITAHGTGYDSPAWQRKNDDEAQTPPGGCSAEGEWAFAQPGVDLNRNNDFQWGGQGTSTDPCDQQYLGIAPDSEPETTAMQSLFAELFRDQRGSGADDPAPPNTTGAMVTMHTDSGLVLLPWSYDSTVHAPNDAGLRSMAFRQSYFNHYPAGQSGEVLYNAAGTSDDWTYATLGIASFTWELDGTGSCSTFLPPYTCMDAYETTNLPGLFYDAAAARRPYKLSLGPTVLTAKAALASGSVTVTATADDAAFGTTGVGRPAAQNVVAGRLYVGKAPWAHGTARPMKVKGTGTSVTLKATVAPQGKRVLAWVQGRDADGNWGPAQAVWVPAG